MNLVPASLPGPKGMTSSSGFWFNWRRRAPARAQQFHRHRPPFLIGAGKEVLHDDRVEADREVERLIAAFGGAEKWQEISRQLLAYGRKNLPEDVLESLSSSFEGVMALHRMMKGQEPGMTVRESEQESAGPADEKELRSMMRDPRYWREKDPAFVARVTKGFERIYSA